MLANVPRPGRSFGGLTRYLLAGAAGTAPSAHRVLWTMTRHLTTEDAMLAAKIMTATADRSVRVQKPVYHAIISWGADEQPTRAAMDAVVATTLADLGLADHQAIIVAHGDTTNPHLHLAINRVHPVTGVAWSTKHDYRRLEQSMYRQATSMGFTAVPGRHTPSARPQALPKVRSRGAMLQARTQAGAAIPLTRLQINDVAPVLRPLLVEAGSWADAVARVRSIGWNLAAKGQGLVLQNPNRSAYVKLSSLGDGVGLQALEQRFGESFRAFAERSAVLDQHAAPPTPLPELEPQPRR